MRRFGSAILMVPAFAALILGGCAGMPQIQVTMPGARSAGYRGPSMGYGPPSTYAPPAMGGATQVAYPREAMGPLSRAFPRLCR